MFLQVTKNPGGSAYSLTHTHAHFKMSTCIRGLLCVFPVADKMYWTCLSVSNQEKNDFNDLGPTVENKVLKRYTSSSLLSSALPFLTALADLLGPFRNYKLIV